MFESYKNSTGYKTSQMLNFVLPLTRFTPIKTSRIKSNDLAEQMTYCS